MNCDLKWNQYSRMGIDINCLSWMIAQRWGPSKSCKIKNLRTKIENRLILYKNREYILYIKREYTRTH